MGRPRNARKCWTRVDALETCKANGSHFNPRLMIGGKSKSQPLVWSLVVIGPRPYLQMLDSGDRHLQSHCQSFESESNV